MPDPNRRAERRRQQAAEVKASQISLRKNVAETKRLVDESDQMLRRHRQERDVDGAADAAG